ncbi:DUF6968 family protein [Roseateles sp. DC23W]|uniref:DUF6968 family protein n=1 Tax=Pelomonas dachongensis TaxID=3299029 RepID=A0ABW7EMB0_9BURK
MPQSDFAAERTWFAVAPDGTEHDFVITIGVPVLGERGEWRSSVTMELVDPKARSIAGMDSWQAIRLAMSFASTRLSHFAEQGWKFYWERGGELATAEDLASVP